MCLASAEQHVLALALHQSSAGPSLTLRETERGPRERQRGDPERDREGTQRERQRGDPERETERGPRERDREGTQRERQRGDPERERDREGTQRERQRGDPERETERAPERETEKAPVITATEQQDSIEDDTRALLQNQVLFLQIMLVWLNTMNQTH